MKCMGWIGNGRLVNMCIYVLLNLDICAIWDSSDYMHVNLHADSAQSADHTVHLSAFSTIIKLLTVAIYFDCVGPFLFCMREHWFAGKEISNCDFTPVSKMWAHLVLTGSCNLSLPYCRWQEHLQ